MHSASASTPLPSGTNNRRTIHPRVRISTCIPSGLVSVHASTSPPSGVLPNCRLVIVKLIAPEPTVRRAVEDCLFHALSKLSYFVLNSTRYLEISNCSACRSSLSLQCYHFMEVVREVLARYLPNYAWRPRLKMNAVQGTEISGKLKTRECLLLCMFFLHFAVEVADFSRDREGTLCLVCNL